MIPQFDTFSTALVTGASGFIGRALIARLVLLGVAVTALSRAAGNGVHGAHRETVGDITDAGFVRAVVAEHQPEVIFHLAARVNGNRAMAEVVPMLRTNLLGTVNVLEAATESGSARVVLAGSGQEPTGEVAPNSPYSASKAAQGTYARMFHSLYGTPVVTARVGMAYGPNQPDVSKVVPHTITTFLRGEVPALSSGQHRYDWVYIDDVVGALVSLAAAPGVEGRALDVGTGTLHSVREVIDRVVDIMQPPQRPAWGAVADRAGDNELAADIATTTRLTGWSPTTDLPTGLRRTVEWYRANHAELQPSRP